LTPTARFLLPHLLFALWLSAAPRAQGARPSSIEPTLIERVWTTDHGLPQDAVTGIAETADGYLWLTTFGGLGRFDGTRFVTTTLDQEPALGTNKLTCLAKGPDDQLWLGTEEFGVVQLRDGRFTHHTERAPRGVIWDIEVDRSGTAWFAGTGLSRYRDGRMEALAPFDAETNATDWLVFDILALADRDELLFATSEGLLRYRDGRFHADNTLSDRGVSRLAEGPSGRIWAISRPNVWALDPGGDAFQPIARCEVSSLYKACVDPNGTLWIAGEAGLASAPADAPFATTDEWPLLETVEHSAAIRRGTRSMHFDARGAAWIGTTRSGLVKLSPAAFGSLGPEIGIRGGAGPIVTWPDGHALFEGSNQYYLWNGRSTRRLPRPYGGALVASELLGSDVDGHLFACKDERLLRIADYGEGEGEVLGDTGSLHGMVRAADGTLWFGGHGELVRFANGSVERVALPYVTRHTTAAVQAPDGAIWFRTRAAVGRYHDGDLRTWRAEHGLPPGEIRGLHVDARGTAWVTSYGGGLARIADGDVTRLGKQHGLPNLSLAGMLADGDGRLWINSNLGVLAIAIADADRVADGHAEQIACQVLPSGECNGTGAAYGAGDKLWFPTVTGVSVIYPEMARSDPNPPKVHVEHIDADGDAVAPEQLPTVGRGHASLEITYTGISFDNPELVQFRYRLGGYEDEWQDVGTRRTAYYTYIPPGDYTFELQASNADGIWSPVHATTAIRVQPFCYQTLWFALLMVATAGLGILALHRSRMRRIERHAHALQVVIDEREAAEEQRRQVEESLRESTKMEAVGRLAGGIAHDFNNVLTAVLGRAQLLETQLRARPDTPRQQLDGDLEHLSAITECSHRAADLTRQLLAFGRQQVLNPVVVAPMTAIRNLRPMLEQLLPENVQLGIEVQQADACVLVDPGQLEQVVMNLVLNARDAMPDGGRIRVSVHTTDVDEAHFARHPQARHPQAQHGPHVVIAVTDSGPGIADSVLPHIFEPFFTTKDQGKGTGLGLASVHGIVTQSRGHITVRDEPTGGTTFCVFLPQVPAEDAPPAASTAGPTHDDGLDGTETILLCEDDPYIRATIRRWFEPRGYRVLEAELPQRARQIAAQDPDIDLLVTDVVMPQQNGRELAAELSVRHPEMAVLFISGYASDLANTEHQLDDDAPFLQKPFTPVELLRKVRDVLDR